MSAGLYGGILHLIAHWRKPRSEIQEDFKFNRRINGYQRHHPWISLQKNQGLSLHKSESSTSSWALYLP